MSESLWNMHCGQAIVCRRNIKMLINQILHKEKGYCILEQEINIKQVSENKLKNKQIESK